MKILLLCNKVPFPARDGSTIAMASIIDALQVNEAEVSVLAFNTVKHYRDPQEITENTPANLELTYVHLNNKVRPFTALINLFSRKAYQVSRFINAEFRRNLIRELKENDYDLVQIEGLSMAVYLPVIRRYSRCKVVLRAHNVEAQIWDRHLRTEPNPLVRTYLRLQNRRLRSFEQKVIYEVDGIVAITRDDLAEFSRWQPGKRAISIPCGVNPRKYPACEDANPEYDIAYVASFDWLPNQQGLRWFLNEVWPLVIQERPGTKFRLGGRDIPKDILNDPPAGVLPEENISSMRSFMCTGRIAVVPLLAGSGMRIKILENMALGICQVTTTIGAEGIAVTHNENIIIADDPANMAREILHLLDNPEKIRQIGQKARERARSRYSNKNLGADLLEFYEYEVC